MSDIKLADLRLDGGTQPRAEIDPFIVDDYADNMSNGNEFPAIVVFYDGSLYWLADGFHRVSAAKQAGLTELAADIRQGTQRDAILYSVGANTSHGLRRTNADKRRAVERLLADNEWSQWSNREIARQCAVSEFLVRDIRNSLSAIKSQIERDGLVLGRRNGTTYILDTSNIGKKQAVYENAPEAVKEAVKDGEITVDRAYRVTEALEGANPRVAALQAKYALDDAERIEILKRLHKSSGSPESNGTFDEIETTGGFHYGDDMELWCNFSEDNITTINKALKSIADYHRHVSHNSDLSPIVETIPQSIRYHVQYGDIWVLGRHRLICGDAYEQITRLQGDALVSDPPYGIDYQPNWNKWNGDKSDFKVIQGDDKPFIPMPFLNFQTVVLFGANYFSQHLPLGGWLCWDKRTKEELDEMFGSPFELAWYCSRITTRRAVMVRLQHGGVVNADSIIGNNEKRYHATQKPIALMEIVLKTLTPDGAIVIDPFAGSGSTLLACERANRNAIAVEIDPEYAAIILQRWADMTGEEPCRE